MNLLSTTALRLAASLAAIALPALALPDLTLAQDAAVRPAPVSTPTSTSAVAPVPTSAGDAEPTGIPQAPIVLEADSLEYEESEEGRRIIADGGVVVEWRGNRLEAGTVTVQEAARRVVAEGGVSVAAPGMTLDASVVDMSLDEETGHLRDVQIRLNDGRGQFGGQKVEKLPGRRYRLEDARYTTCVSPEGEPPDWEVAGEEIDIEVDGYGSIRNGAFRVRGFPVLPIPYLVFPAKETRQSGFLMPSMGSSNRRGFLYSQPYFHAFDKHHDATLTAEVETRQRIGLTGVYRYRPSLDRRGAVEVGMFDESVRGSTTGSGLPDLDPGDIPTERGLLDVRHRDTLANGDVYADVLLVSDDFYLREIESGALKDLDGDTRRTRRYTKARAGVLSHSGFASYGLEGQAFQDLDRDFFRDREVEQPMRGTVQKPVSLWARADGDLLGGFGWQVDATADTFLRHRGADGQRVDVLSRVARPIPVGDALHASAWVGGRATAYRMDETTTFDPAGDLLGELDESPFRTIVETGVEARTKLARDYEFDGDTGYSTSVRHIVEPFAEVVLRGASGDTELPLYDAVDAIEDRSVVSYGFDSRFVRQGKDDEEPVEFARLAVAQSYNLEDRVVADHFSDIDLAAFVRPADQLSLRTLTSINPQRGEITGSQASLAYEAGPSRWLPGPRSQVALSYRFVRGDAAAASARAERDGDVTGAGVLEGIETAEGLALLGVSENVSLGFTGRYDLESTRFVEHGAGVRVRSDCDCWTVDVGFLSRVNPDERQVRVMVELGGLGALGRGAAENPSPALQELAYGDLGFWRPGW